MGKYISKDNVPTIVFKRNNPSLYEKIMELYSPVFDAATAIELYINNIPSPRCSICNVRLQVNKHKPTRCKKHVNVKSLYKYEDLSNKNKLSIEFFEGYKNSSEKIMHERINYIKEKYGTIIGQTKNI